VPHHPTINSSAVISAGFAAMIATAVIPGGGRAAEPCGETLACLDQGWSETERQWWYRTTQGSRLLPLSWALALEEPTRESRFFSDENFRALGYLPAAAAPDNPHGLPLGFAVDQENSRRADIMCETLPETCNGRLMRRPWIGMTCSACHTNEISYGGQRIRIDGAPTLADFQRLLEQVLAALQATRDDEAKFDRFARLVLGTDLSVQTRTQLLQQLNEQIAWQTGLIERNAPGIRYGYGRLDAQGHILNKVVTIGGGDPIEDALVSDAPASYPHIWNTAQHDKVQWNGIANNILNIPIFSSNTDLGALVRNTSEVIGVFAHIEVSRPFLSDLLGYNSSLRIENMIDLERQLARLKSPRWPETILPPIDWAKAEKGRVHYEALCLSCHSDLKWDDLQTPIRAAMSPVKLVETDIMLACNTFLHQSNAGDFAGRRPFLLQGDRIEAVDATRDMLINAAVAAVLGRADELAAGSFDDVFRDAGPIGAPTEAGTTIEYLPGAADPRKKELARACLESAEANNPGDKSILAYKARPLNGIWATAPYLHNGSVPTLYDLLLPSPLRISSPIADTPGMPGEGDRPSSFFVGSRVFDPVKVGFETKAADILTRSDGEKVKAFEFKVYDGEGKPIPGNYNSGHDYGTDILAEEERWELVEYLKSI
jgi:hypothetical protein